MWDVGKDGVADPTLLRTCDAKGALVEQIDQKPSKSDRSDHTAEIRGVRHAIFPAHCLR